MFSRQFVRFFHVKFPLYGSVNKSDLAKLRKKTGYTFSNCKKALEVNNNDIKLAEDWLKQQAQALGWTKATKLEGRTTLQGLIGVTLKGNTALMVEVNCETDFVARNKKFQSLVELAAQSCLNHAVNLTSSEQFSKIALDSTTIRELPTEDGKTLADQAAITMSTVGENLNFRRAVVFKSNDNIHLAGYTHPSPSNPNTLPLYGKFGSLVAYEASSPDEQIHQLARQLCQHVVGMNPSKVGVAGADEPLENKDEESVMLHQDFLLDPSVTVSQLINDNGIQIVDFVRFECGENITKEEDSEQLKAFSQN